jgi:hypothetical protein
MRTIKFRGYSEQLKCFVYGFFQEVEVEGVVYSYIFWQGNVTPVRADSVAQFTGLQDRNGKEIYERDIVKIKNNGILVVCFFKGEFKLQTLIEYHKNRNIYALISHLEFSECIGNIDENPELLSTQTAALY